MKKFNLFFGVLCSIVLLAACSSDDDNPSDNAGGDQIAVFMVSTSSSDFDVQYDNTTFCYQGEDCNVSVGLSFATVFGNDKMRLETSDSQKVAEGVLIENIQIDGGTGLFEVVSGTQTSSGFQESNVLFTSNEFSSGETATVEWGRTE